MWACKLLTWDARARLEGLAADQKVLEEEEEELQDKEQKVENEGRLSCWYMAFVAIQSF